MNAIEKQQAKKFEAYQAGAKKRRKSWSLTFQEFLHFCEQPCHYCGAAPLSGGSNRWPHNGIDRKNNSVGYNAENCLPCCSFCNRAKGQRDYATFQKYLTQVRKCIPH